MWIQPPVCPRCGVPRLSPQNGVSEWRREGSPALCGVCRACPPAFHYARSLAAYEGPLREAICALKYRRRRAVGFHLGHLLAEQTPASVPPGVSAVVPVPLHPMRLTERGFNQAEVLARPVAETLGVPCLPAALRRLGREAQAGLRAAARRQNVLDAFEPGPARVRGIVLLVDDVLSTGSTAAACASALVAAGAERVAVLTLARAILRQGGGAGTPHPIEVGQPGSRSVKER